MRTLRHGMLALLMILVLLAQPAASTPSAAASTLAGPITVDLTTVADARTQGGSPDVNFGSGFLFVSTLNGHISFVAFDLLALPVGATVEAARLEIDAQTLNDGPNNVEVGRVDGAWDEASLTWASQPAITWGGPVTNVVGPTLATWDVTALVQAWHSGARPNYGFGLRGDGGEALSFSSKEAGVNPPTLVVRYTVPADESARPDLGDAPDSTNHHGANNTAYAAAGTLGQFPTVWQVPAGQPAGPRHTNASGEGFLGQAISREQDADTGVDQDGRNNILRSPAGAVVDVADQDRGDDGWRNRNIRFFDCQRQTLQVRVSKAPAATLKKMYLNVWIDGDRSGLWGGTSPCPDPNGGPARAGYEWIVQDYVIDMTAIPAGGFLDFAVNTELVANSSEGLPHWMRFTLSERRAVQPPGGAYPDGRGPHPSSAQPAFSFGETEDYLQVPPPPGQSGSLELLKRVTTTSEPTEWIDYVTYEIKLRHVGGSQPVQARIRDLLPYPLIVYPTISGSQIEYVVVSSPGGAAPLSAQLTTIPPSGGNPPQQQVSWDGALAPDSEVVLTFQVRVIALCAPNQQTMTFTNVAQARPDGGAEITAQDSFVAKCIGYDSASIEVTAEPIQLDPIDLTDPQNLPLQYSLKNNHTFSVTLGLAQERLDAAQVDAIALPSFQQLVTLGPGESRPVEVTLGLEAAGGDELAAADVTTIESRLRYCLVIEQSQTCPDPTAYPHLSGQGPLITVRLKPHDLGDAPDSTNHPAAAMTAYPGVPAAFPTVFDPATGAPAGPLHAHPRPFHLGQRVSLEAEADIGPDQDPTNNILPAANQPNRDRFDDGSRLNPPAANCQATTADVQVAITPAAWNWFKGREQPAYLNSWVDSNRNGSFADGFSCAGPSGQQVAVVEHIVIDFPIDVAALGPGLHTLSVPTSRVAWPAQLAQQPAWVRFTLSERPSNKTLTFQGISYGDGRGFPAPFTTGETEDHLLMPQSGEGQGAPDLALGLGGRLSNGRVGYRIEVANQGTAEASGATLTFTPPAALAGTAPDILRAPGIPAADITQANGTISFKLPAVADGASNTIMVGWALPAAASAQAAPQATSYVASAVVSLASDSDSSNNSASLTLEKPRQRIVLAALAADGKAWGQRDSTCRAGVTLVGKAEPNAIIAILIGLLVDGTVTADASGNFSYTVDGLEPGRHQIEARYDGITSPRDPASGQATGVWIDVDPSMPIDPLSLSFTDSKGRVYHPRTLGWGNGADADDIRLRAGETYEVGVDSCLDEPVETISLSIADVVVAKLYDDDGDGRYTASFSYSPAAPQAAQLAQASGGLQLSVTAGGATRSFAAPLSAAAGGVADADSGQPLAGAQVSAQTADGDLWAAAALGAANPQTTGADGAYSFGAAGAASRLAASRSGYQAYVSWELDGAALDQSLALSPELAGTPDATIYITADGFDPPLLTVRPGALVEWINLDLAEHGAAGAAWDSGALAAGGRYRARVTQAGSYSYSDAGAGFQGTLIAEGATVLIPLVRR